MLFNLASPPEGAFATYNELLSQLQNHTRAYIYIVAIGRSKRE